MSHQQDLFPPQAQESAHPSPQPTLEQTSPPAPIWLQRLSIVVLVVFCFYVGLLLCLLPWTRYWNENHYLLTVPGLGPLMYSGITRGIVSGLGLLDLWIGISEVIHYREDRA